MLNTRRHLHILAIAAIVLACAFTQSWLLRHELVDCLPYKIMSISNRYQMVSQLAFWCGPIAAVAFVFTNYLLKENSSLSWVVSLGATLLCPIVFIIIFRVLTPTPAPNIEAPDFGTDAAWSQFLEAIKFNAVAGFICSGVLIGIAKSTFKRFRSLSA